MNITQSQYEFALAKIEELLPLVPEDASADDKDAVELSILSDVVIEYEKEHFPIEKGNRSQPLPYQRLCQRKSRTDLENSQFPLQGA